MTTQYEALVAGRVDGSKEILDLEIPSRRPAWARTAKRATDVVGAGFGVLALAPLLALVAILVKLQDGGPVLHRRRVVGPRGSFDAFKFRSMRPDADAILDADPSLQNEFQRNFKLQNDHRVTPLGALLRKYSVDELPQLWNVLLGQMSLVGPRMITAEELQKYGDYQHLMLSVKPGLTGYWQVSGRQGIDYSRRVQMDMYYIKNWTLTFDLRILLQTPGAVVKATGAL
jgi:lipopolysaccharide/colanic/teichoic acid biosynthesis glycosyltransferase